MRSKNDIFCFIGKRGAGKDELAKHIGLPVTTVSKILTQYCQENDLPADRDTMIKLGNTVFDGENLALLLQQDIPVGGAITGIRKPDTLYYLMQQNRCFLIGVLADDDIRRERVMRRNRLGDYMSFDEFLEHEKKENAPPNKQNTDLLLAFCDIHITNNMTKDELITKGQTAIAKLSFKKESKTHIDLQGYQHFSRAILCNEYDEILVLYDMNKQIYTLPGGKVDRGETPDVAIQRELGEEVGIIPHIVYCGSLGGLFRDGLSKGHFFEGQVTKAEIKLCEPTLHSEMLRIPKNQLQEKLGYIVYIDSGLYHYAHNQWMKNWDIHSDFSQGFLSDNLYLQYVDREINKVIVQQIGLVEGDNIVGKGDFLSDKILPIRIMSGTDMQKGIVAQKEREKRAKIL